MRITDIRPKSPRSAYYRISFDQQHEIFLLAETVLAFQLKPSLQISPIELQEIEAHTEFLRSKRSAFYSLARRAHTEKELRIKLKRKGYSETAVEKTIDRLKELDMISDKDFAEAFIDSQLRKKAVGKKKLEITLRQKGVSEKDIENALNTCNLQPLSHCKKAVEKKLRQLQRETDPKKKKDKLIAYLMRQGFEWDTIRETLKGSEF